MIIFLESTSLIIVTIEGSVSSDTLVNAEEDNMDTSGLDRARIDYSIDEQGRRVIGDDYNPAEPDLLLFGDSFTFGYKLFDNETLHHHLSDSMDYNIYNYAQVGDGPHNTLAILQYDVKEIFEDVDMDDEDNIAIFQFLPEEHTRRASAKPPNSIRRIFTDPSYIYDEDGDLIEGDSFYRDRYLRSLVHANYWFLRKDSFFLERFAPSNIFLNVNEHDIKLTLDIILNISEAYEEHFEGDFYILFAPIPMYDNQDLRDTYVSLFEEEGLDYLLYDIDGRREDYIISEFQHPNSRLNKKLSDLLVEDILDSP